MIRSLKTVTVGIFVAALTPVAALASQGPGTGPGTASPALQFAMALVVYGGAAAVVAAGLVGALRKG